MRLASREMHLGSAKHTVLTRFFLCCLIWTWWTADDKLDKRLRPERQPLLVHSGSRSSEENPRCCQPHWQLVDTNCLERIASFRVLLANCFTWKGGASSSHAVAVPFVSWRRCPVQVGPWNAFYIVWGLRREIPLSSATLIWKSQDFKSLWMEIFSALDDWP